MSDVVRFVRDYQEVVYTVGPDTVRRAICAWLHDNEGAAFTGETTITFCEGGGVAVKESTAPKHAQKEPE